MDVRSNYDCVNDQLLVNHGEDIPSPVDYSSARLVNQQQPAFRPRQHPGTDVQRLGEQVEAVVRNVLIS
jgi:hypothetical protein